MDTTLRYVNENQTGQFRNQRTMSVAGARETIGSQVVQQMVIQCFNCKEFGHFAKECRKPKRVKDYTYHKEKMLLCKQAEKGVSLQAEQAHCLADTHEEVDEQELEAHYMYMAKIQEVHTTDSGPSFDAESLEKECKFALEECKSSLEDSNITRDRCIVALQNKEIELEKYMTYHDRTIEHDTLERKLKDTLELLAQKEHDIKE
ncbi:putative reverse transcriptase domain-containing protein, partial [Tanacetum coccineum]